MISIRRERPVRARGVQETISIVSRVQQVAPFRLRHGVFVASGPIIVPDPPISFHRGEQRAPMMMDEALVPSITRTRRTHLATMEIALRRTLPFLAAPYWIKSFIELSE